jgi:membrane-bound metal-dependent hydrolase YbcI (DUF457 family)
MLPPGHIAAGFLTSKALLYLAHPRLSLTQQTQLLWWGMFFSFAPDLDNFVAYAKIKSFWYKKDQDNTIHRRFYSHIPIIWLVAGLSVYFLSGSAYYKIFGLLIWMGSWTHFALDSIDMYGIMWLWPFNKGIWALKNRSIEKKIEGNGFISFWMNFLKYYVTTWTFYVEIVLLILALFFVSQ